MRLPLAFGLLAAAPVPVAASTPTPARAAEMRIALAIGNAAYRAGPVATAANDAGLVARTLQAAAFDVVDAGPDAAAFVDLASYGRQLEGANDLAPADPCVSAEMSLRAVRISDDTKSLAALPRKARFSVLDGAQRTPFSVPETPFAGGLAPTEAATQGAEILWKTDQTTGAFAFFDRAPDTPPLGRGRAATLRDRPLLDRPLLDRPLRGLGVQDAYAVCLKRDDSHPPCPRVRPCR